jgi:hypothetical protein
VLPLQAAATRLPLRRPRRTSARSISPGSSRPSTSNFPEAEERSLMKMRSLAGGTFNCGGCSSIVGGGSTSAASQVRSRPSGPAHSPRRLETGRRDSRTVIETLPLRGRGVSRGRSDNFRGLSLLHSPDAGVLDAGRATVGGTCRRAADSTSSWSAGAKNHVTNVLTT